MLTLKEQKELERLRAQDRAASQPNPPGICQETRRYGVKVMSYLSGKPLTIGSCQVLNALLGVLGVVEETKSPCEGRGFGGIGFLLSYIAS